MIPFAVSDMEVLMCTKINKLSCMYPWTKDVSDSINVGRTASATKLLANKIVV